MAKVVALDEVTDKNIGQVRYLNKAILPVRYNEKFYRDLHTRDPAFTRLAYYRDLMVGAVACREDPADEGEEGTKIYIMTFGVLAPYRRLGIGRTMLEYVVNDLCKARKDARKVQLHVQTSNDVAVEFYKKMGFTVVKEVPGYFKRIEPSSAFLMERAVNCADATQENSPENGE